MVLAVDAGDRILTAFGHPGGAVGTDHHAVRRRAGSKRDHFQSAVARVEQVERPVALAAKPHRAVGVASDVARARARTHDEGSQAIAVEIARLDGGAGGRGDGGGRGKRSGRNGKQMAAAHRALLWMRRSLCPQRARDQQSAAYAIVTAPVAGVAPTAARARVPRRAAARRFRSPSVRRSAPTLASRRPRSPTAPPSPDGR
jgi:hypothetical protein